MTEFQIFQTSIFLSEGIKSRVTHWAELLFTEAPPDFDFNETHVSWHKNKHHLISERCMNLLEFLEPHGTLWWASSDQHHPVDEEA